MRSPLLSRRARLWYAGVAVLTAVFALIPPLSSQIRHYESFEALQFSIFAIVVPALLAIGAPWWLFGLASPPGAEGAATAHRRSLDRLADSRRRHPEFIRALGFLLVDLVVVVGWRMPDTVNAVAAHRWLVAPEALTLTVAGIGLWLELVESPPSSPRLARPWRAVVASLAMWTTWSVAYFVALSNTIWYRSYHHVAGHGLSANADQQFSSVVLWMVAALAFLPVVFWNLVYWLKSEDDPDEELQALVRRERRHAWATPPPLGRDEGPPPG